MVYCLREFDARGMVQRPLGQAGGAQYECAVSTTMPSGECSALLQARVLHFGGPGTPVEMCVILDGGPSLEEHVCAPGKGSEFRGPGTPVEMCVPGQGSGASIWKASLSSKMSF